MNLKNKVLVTGGCGFIGSHLVDLLVDNSYEVVVVDNLSAESNSKFYYNNKAIYYPIDINDDSFPHEEIFVNCKWVFHLAAESRIGPSIKNPIRAAQINVLGTTKMLQYSRNYNVDKFVYSSTSSVYGNECELPTNEDSPIDCLNPYSATKYSGEEMVRMYNKMYNVNSIVLRYFNVFGQRSPFTGQYAPVIGIFQRQKREGEPLTIVGTGEQRRDFIHVKDVARANFLAAIGSVNRGVFNIGSGTNISVNEIASKISTDVTFVPPREGEAKHTLADITNAIKYLNFKPTITVEDYLNNNIQDE